MSLLKRSLFILTLLLTAIPLNAGDFSIARLKYSGGGDWYCDPTSLVNLQKFVEKNTGIEMAEREAVVSPMDADLYSYPFLYMTGHGNVKFSQAEADRLRDYLMGGGFLHCDDNYGLDESFRRELKKIFPNKDLVELPFTHPIYHMAYDFPKGLPKIHEHDKLPAQGLAIVVDNRVVLFYTYQCDLGDGWEDADVHNDPPAKREAALKMGANILMYALGGRPVNLP